MEHVHGVDVSWMIHGSPRGKTNRPQRRNTLPSTTPDEPPLSPTQSAPPATPSTPKALSETAPAPAPASTPPPVTPSPKPAAASSRPALIRHGSNEKPANGVGTPPQRRNSWFSNISSKFASVGQSPPQANNTPPKQAEISVPRANPAKNAVLQHAARYEGDGPYTPAPPKSTQAGLLQVLRRLSAGSSGSMSPTVKGNHGLVERKILNVDRHRERCSMTELNQAKLRRVSFCVDVEIAPMPKYAAESDGLLKKVCKKATPERRQSEGDLAKTPKVSCDESRESAETVAAKAVDSLTARNSTDTTEANGQSDVVGKAARDSTDGASVKGEEPSRKKEKKKKSEEERKARKEKKRKQAEVNGTVPMEIHLDSDSSGSGAPASGPEIHSARSQSAPTTNPVRIYRRCCQLRETPILKKITEQLANTDNFSAETGVVERLDLTAYWMQLPDLVTLGDYLAVVPIKEVILENCGLNDEGLRVVLAGLLAAKKPPQTRARRTYKGEPDGLVMQGGVVERLVLRNNKIGPEGWKHLCLFVYLCRSLKHLDVSILSLPHRPAPRAPASTSASPLPSPLSSPLPSPASSGPQPTRPLAHARAPLDLCQLLSKCLGNRLAGAKLELLNLGETLPDATQLGLLIDGVIKCGVRRLGLARNNIDADGIVHVSRYLASGLCEGLDLVGNDLRDCLDAVANAISDESQFAALSLAECNLKPASLCNLLPKLARLREFRFLDLSHNQDLFGSSPSSITVLRRNLPKMANMKKIHLKDVSMGSEEAIALAEILPEIKGLAHINLLENPELTKLADARTEETQEEACALYASLLAATRVSPSIVAVDVDVPTEQSGEIVKALAKQVVAYCLRNMENLALPNAPAAVDLAKQEPEYPDVLQHLVGHDVLASDETDEDEPAPDDDYVIGGTGVVKALACCLKNRGDESRRPSGEFVRDVSGAVPTLGESSPLATPASPGPDASRRRLQQGKAKDMSKHLLGSARKIRHRLQPAMAKAKAVSTHTAQDAHAYQRLLFLDRTLDGIIRRFEDEFPDTRELQSASAPDSTRQHPSPPSMPMAASFGSEGDMAAALSDVDDDGTEQIRRPAISRSNSIISMTSKGLTNQEGRILRAVHKFRSGWITQMHYDILSGAVEQIESESKHARFLSEMLDDLNDDRINQMVKEKGVMAVFRDHRPYIIERFRSQDPEHWERFVESQKMARANVQVDRGSSSSSSVSFGSTADAKDATGRNSDGGNGGRPRVTRAEGAGDEVAVSDD